MLATFGMTHAPDGIEAYEQGYVALDDGRVMDPTRWTFEMVEPYIYVGPATDYQGPLKSIEKLVVELMMRELATGTREPYSGQGLHPRTRRALLNPWFRPLFELASKANVESATTA